MEMVVNSQATGEIYTANSEEQAQEQTQEQTQQSTEGQAQETQTQQESQDKPAEENTSNFENIQETEQELKEDLTQRGIDFNALEDEYLNNGQLSEESLAKLEKEGYPRNVVFGYLKGIESEAQNFYNTVVNYAGGEEEYKQLQSFVQAQGAQAVDTFNNAINTGNQGVIKMVIQGIKADMQNKYGSTNATILGTSAGAPTGNATGYDNKEEMVQAMSDPRYGKDPKYTQEVSNKVKLSTFF